MSLIPDSDTNPLAAALAAPSENAEAEVSVSRGGPWVPWLVAAIVAIASLWLVRQNLGLNAERDSQSIDNRDLQLKNRALRQQVEAEQLLGRGEIARLRTAELAADPARWQVTLLEPPTGVPTGARGVVCWNPLTGQGTLFVTGLPPADATYDYQLWLAPVAPAIRTLGGGVLTVNAATNESRLGFKTTGAPPGRFTITREPHGGAPKPTGAVVLSGP